jgi:hypothetical protein
MSNSQLALTDFREKEIWNDGYLTGSSEAGNPEMMLYRHLRTGNLYTKLYETEIVDTKQQIIVYCSVETLEVWARDAAIFNERFEEVDEG